LTVYTKPPENNESPTLYYRWSTTNLIHYKRAMMSILYNEPIILLSHVPYVFKLL